MNKHSILIVEDDDLVRESLYDVLTVEGYDVVAARDSGEALEAMRAKGPELAMIDLRLPSGSGIDVFRQVRQIDPKLEVIMMTSFATVETAVEAMKMGVVDYLTKPINDDELRLTLQRVFESRQLKQENESLKQELSNKKSRFHHIIGEDAKMQKIYSIVEAISNTDTTVLLKGESGTGKGMIARAIHQNDPARKDGPYIEVSCGAIPRELLESELFGHVKGAFTSAIRDRMGRFELANGGTILLDEIDALPPYLQVKLLRVLQQKEFERVGDTKTVQVDVRIIASTNVDLASEIKKGRFREDLYYRLNVITIGVPPLRDRKQDVATLVKHFLQVFSSKTKREICGISQRAMKVLIDYDWPGNVRELENLLERAVVLSEGDVIDLVDFPENMFESTNASDAAPALPKSSLKDGLKEPEKMLIKKALEQVGWNRQRAARILNINRTTLYNKMKEYALL
ncbi:MAG: sigma-54 dependent transcriptional regulator [Candidatus Omnitrophota bacterium]|nr:sigma-54 dependent transcriptional regulator [Candidatus Omnitrophota bacterium]